jgi:hypothetical protein
MQLAYATISAPGWCTQSSFAGEYDLGSVAIYEAAEEEEDKVDL